MNIYQYTALNNPNGARQVVESYSIRADRKLLPKQLAFIVAKHGEEALSRVASIHPDLPCFKNKLTVLRKNITKKAKKKVIFQTQTVNRLKMKLVS